MVSLIWFVQFLNSGMYKSMLDLLPIVLLTTALFLRKGRMIKKSNASEGNEAATRFAYSTHGRYYQSSGFRSIIYIDDSDYHSGLLFLKAIDSLNFRVTIRFSFSRISHARAERVLKNLLAERKSELRLIGGRNSILSGTLARHVNSLREMSRRLLNNGNSIYDGRFSFRVEDEHPVPLMRDMERFRSVMSLMGFSMKSGQSQCRNRIEEFSSLRGNPGRKYLVDSRHISETMPVFFENKPVETGIMAGLDDDTEKPVFIDVFNENSFNIMVFGETGSGKSFFTKLILKRTLVGRRADSVIVFDPLNEYFCSMFEDDCLEVRINEGEYIDPFEEFEVTNENISLISSMLTDFPSEGAVTQTHISQLIREYIKSGKRPELPELLRYLNENIEDVSLRMSLSESEQALFARRINLGMEKTRPVLILKFGKMLGESLNRAMILSLYGMMMRTRTDPDKRKLILLDEAHLITASPAGRRVLGSIVRHSRHYRTSVINVTQNFSDFIVDSETESILLNSSSTFIFRTREEIDWKKASGTGFAAELEPAYLMGGMKDPYSECYYTHSGKVRRLRIICTEKEKNNIER